jgi:hypothetical protein
MLLCKCVLVIDVDCRPTALLRDLRKAMQTFNSYIVPVYTFINLCVHANTFQVQALPSLLSHCICLCVSYVTRISGEL